MPTGDPAPNLAWIANYIWGIADDVLRDLKKHISEMVAMWRVMIKSTSTLTKMFLSPSCDTAGYIDFCPICGTLEVKDSNLKISKLVSITLSLSFSTVT